jgi:hypothetical protein
MLVRVVILMGMMMVTLMVTVMYVSVVSAKEIPGF